MSAAKLFQVEEVVVVVAVEQLILMFLAFELVLLHPAAVEWLKGATAPSSQDSQPIRFIITKEIEK